MSTKTMVMKEHESITKPNLEDSDDDAIPPLSESSEADYDLVGLNSMGFTPIGTTS